MDAFNSQSEPVNVNEIQTAEALLAKLRAGNNQKLEIGLGDFKTPVRLLDAAEEARILAESQIAATKLNPSGVQKEVFEAQITMKQILVAATSINGQVGMSKKFLDLLTHVELSELFDQYNTLNHTINPSVQSLRPEEIIKLVESVKKKQKTAKDFYTWQLAAIGTFFLDSVLPMLQTANDSGT